MSPDLPETAARIQPFRAVPDPTEGCKTFGPLLLRGIPREEQADRYRRAP